MQKISINLTNCYGIKSLEYTFDFGTGKGHKKSFSIYAPNGLMKTSFTKTFEKLSAGETPKEERFNRKSQAEVLVDDTPIKPEAIHILKSEIDLTQESPEISNILVNPERKSRYDSLILEIDKQKTKAIAALQKLSGVPKKDIEEKILADTDSIDFYDCLLKLSNEQSSSIALPPFNYATVFDNNIADLSKKPEFLTNAKEFSERYQELFTQEGTIFKKDIFSPIKADRSFSTLKSQGYFDSGHLLHLNGDSSPVGVEALEERLKLLLSKIEDDQRLKTIKDEITKNAQTQALAKLFENLPMVQIEELLEGLKPENHKSYKCYLWKLYAASSQEVKTYLTLYLDARDEINSIEKEAASFAPAWTSAVELFNDRFTDMPFRLSVENHVQAALGKEQAKLLYIFKEGEDVAKLSRGELKTLSQGEKRALYLLNFIFEVEAKSKLNHETLFIIDDIADSFDYKNKHAIVQYLEDLEEKQNVYQIILTHNYDFFRSLTKFVHRAKCLMANRYPDKIVLEVAEGVANYFTGILKRDFANNPRAMCAAIPFTRNIIEYTKGEDDPEYLLLTSLLHQKENTDRITHEDFVNIYNSTFNSQHKGSEKAIKEIIFEQADAVANNAIQTGLNLEDKVVLSMAIRLKAENYMLGRIRVAENDQNYWCTSHSQFGVILGIYTKKFPECPSLQTLRKVSVTVSSNIHLNSFMYEPILDLSTDHLAKLYRDVDTLA